MTALDTDMAAVRARLIASFYEQPEIRARLDMAHIATAVDVALAGAGVRDLVVAVADGAVAVAALSAETPSPTPTTAAKLAQFDGSRATAHPGYPTAIP